MDQQRRRLIALLLQLIVWFLREVLKDRRAHHARATVSYLRTEVQLGYPMPDNLGPVLRNPVLSQRLLINQAAFMQLYHACQPFLELDFHFSQYSYMHKDVFVARPLAFYHGIQQLRNKHNRGRPREPGNALRVFLYLWKVMRGYNSLHDITMHFASPASCYIHVRHAIWAVAQALLNAEVIKWPTQVQQANLYHSLPGLLKGALGAGNRPFAAIDCTMNRVPLYALGSDPLRYYHLTS